MPYLNSIEVYTLDKDEILTLSHSLLTYIIFMNRNLMWQWNFNSICIKGFFNHFAELTFNSPLFSIDRFCYYPKYDIRCANCLYTNDIWTLDNHWIVSSRFVTSVLHDSDGFVDIFTISNANVNKGTHISSRMVANTCNVTIRDIM